MRTALLKINATTGESGKFKIYTSKTEKRKHIVNKWFMLELLHCNTEQHKADKVHEVRARFEITSTITP